MASSADDAVGSDMGGKIMLAGIAFQLGEFSSALQGQE
jgi:hypothetical protein